MDFNTQAVEAEVLRRIRDILDSRSNMKIDSGKDHKGGDHKKLGNKSTGDANTYMNFGWELEEVPSDLDKTESSWNEELGNESSDKQLIEETDNNNIFGTLNIRDFNAQPE